MKEIDIDFPDIKLKKLGRRPTTKDDVRALLQLIGMSLGNVLEIGAWYGKTTYEIASRFPGRKFHTVDWLENELSEREENTRAHMLDLCMYAKHLSNVSYEYKKSSDINYRDYDNIRMVFIDGDHSYDGVKADTEKAIKELLSGSIIAWHDARNGTFGVPHYIKKEIEPRYKVNIFKGTQIAYIVT